MGTLMWACLLMQRIRALNGGDALLQDVDAWLDESEQSLLWAIVEALHAQDDFGGEKPSFGVDTLIAKLMKKLVHLVRDHQAQLQSLRMPVNNQGGGCSDLRKAGEAAEYIASLEGIANFRQNVGAEYILFWPENAFKEQLGQPGEHTIEQCSWFGDTLQSVHEALTGEKAALAEEAQMMAGFERTKKVYRYGLLITVPESTPTKEVKMPNGEIRVVIAEPDVCNLE